MKHFLFTLSLTAVMIICAVSFTPVSAQLRLPDAQNGGASQSCDPNSGNLCNPLNYTSVYDLIIKLLDIVAQVGLVVCTLFIILAGFKYVTANGNMTKVQDAHKILLWSVIGTAVLLGAKVLASILSNTVNQLIK